MWHALVCTDGTGLYWPEAVKGWEGTGDSASPAGFVKIRTSSPFAEASVALQHAFEVAISQKLRVYPTRNG